MTNLKREMQGKCITVPNGLVAQLPKDPTQETKASKPPNSFRIKIAKLYVWICFLSSQDLGVAKPLQN